MPFQDVKMEVHWWRFNDKIRARKLIKRSKRKEEALEKIKILEGAEPKTVMQNMCLLSRVKSKSRSNRSRFGMWLTTLNNKCTCFGSRQEVMKKIKEINRRNVLRGSFLVVFRIFGCYPDG